MGQQSSLSQEPEHLRSDILNHEMKIYQWRSDPNFNQFVARVGFKSAFAQHQQELYAEFLRMQETKEYLQIYKFRQELQRIPDTKDEQVVIFEPYHSSLQEFKGKLSFEQTLYVLSGLLTGYEEIKKVLEKVVVDSSCCFLTKQGSLRVWINPNPRSNQLWMGMFKELAPRSSHVDIISQTIRMAEDSLRPSKRGHLFFSQLNSIFNTQAYKNSTFSLFRRWINEYCYLHKIQIAQSITLKARLQPELQSQIRGSREYTRHHRNTEAREQPSFNKENDPFAETRYSQMQDSSLNRAFLIKSKSMEKEAFRFSYQNGSTIKAQESSNQHSTTQPTLNHSNSQILQKKTLQNGKFSLIVQRDNQESTCSNKLNQIKESTYIWSDVNKTSSILKGKLDEIPSIKNSTSKLSKMSKASVCHKLTEKEIQVSLHPSDQKIELPPKKTMEKQPKSSMQVSIMKAIPQHREEDQAEFRRANNKYKTVYSPKQSIECINNESELFSRPWITTKTITRLLSENDNESSLQNSIAESSEYYNTSNYSGALTQMGRDIVLKEEVQNGKSKTVRVSRQI